MDLYRSMGKMEKTRMLGKIEGRKRDTQRMGWLDGIPDTMDMSLSELEQAKVREARHGSPRVRQDQVTKQQQREAKMPKAKLKRKKKAPCSKCRRAISGFCTGDARWLLKFPPNSMVSWKKYVYLLLNSWTTGISSTTTCTGVTAFVRTLGFLILWFSFFLISLFKRKKKSSMSVYLSLQTPRMMQASEKPEVLRAPRLLPLHLGGWDC